MSERPIGVVAVVATFNPDDGLLDNVRQIISQVDSVVIVDDASTNGAKVLSECEELGAQIIRFAVNGGIARSLNAGIRAARAQRAKYVLTLDQDTEIPDRYVETLVSAILSLRRSGVNVGLVTAGRMNGYDRRPRRTHDGVIVGIDVMQSGCLYEMDTVNEVGEFREDFVIDCVDTEYCLRLRRHGAAVVWVPNLELRHTVGATSPVYFFGRRFVIFGKSPQSSNHADFRRYYMMRNRLLLYAEFGRSDWEWLRHSVPNHVKDTLLAIVFEAGRASRLRAIGQGIADAIRNRTGPMASRSLPERRV
ncbi:glycosyltransferase [Agreia bicolorata]|uniref:Glycosyltransferase 2-like domain-containing protein n=1 Tax=Agreia bicolorata TaxID=110935 RepID=A0ABR5CDF8_9MICO|nr:glycosyltransferase [Agreia bicolorata]KJC63683.1 hypothetical protein TZ00_14395 [Agreia bicolorata]